MDGYISQQNIELNREIFMFLKTIIVKESDYKEILDLLKNKDFRSDWIPRITENHYTFAGEMNTIKEATYDNFRELSFEIKKQKQIVKYGDKGYYPKFLRDGKTKKVELADEIEIERSITKEFEVLMPVCEYNWESYHSSTNKAGHQKTLSKELSFDLNLINRPQTFNLFEIEGEKATINISSRQDDKNSQEFIFLRKDLIDRYLKINKYKLIWGLWGEKQISFKEYNDTLSYLKKHKLEGMKKFKTITPYL